VRLLGDTAISGIVVYKQIPKIDSERTRELFPEAKVSQTDRLFAD
jgi:hypothetical protein